MKRVQAGIFGLLWLTASGSFAQSASEPAEHLPSNDDAPRAKGIFIFGWEL